MTTEPAPTAQWQRDLLARHQLHASYLESAQKWFAPLVGELAALQNSADRPILVALNGCQGSGKTTVSDYLCTALSEEHALHAIALSLDDFYLTHAQRQALAAAVHPLFATRGVPGTHDMTLLRATLQQLLRMHSREPVVIPRFDKSTDDRRPVEKQESILPPVHVVLVEGWCLGATPQPAKILSQPINDLERDEDADGVWRQYSNDCLRVELQPLYALVDQWIMLRAPSFDCVFDWRREQEQKLVASTSAAPGSRLMNDDALRRFIQHYERITRHCLEELPGKVDHLFCLDEQRRVTRYRQLRQNGGTL
ncbi:MAG: hypothetical protein R3E64_18120 [Halioglobus sp.]